MKIVIKNKSDVPIYEQIKEEIRNAILSGEAVENEQLPSIRQLARDLKISVITTTRAMTDLVDEGFLVSVAGKGYFVAPRNNELMRERVLSHIEAYFEDAIESADSIGLSEDELVTILKNMQKQ